VWESQFGGPGLLAGSESAQSAAQSSSVEPTPEPALASGELVDVALALALAEAASRDPGASEVVRYSLVDEYSSTELSQLRDSGLRSGLANRETTGSPLVDERESSAAPSPWEVALDKVFTSVFE
jgi:hypothetical protein